MVCDPNEHNFVKQTSYSIDIETDSAVVKNGTEEKRCKKCDKTPSELGDFVSSDTDTETESDQSSSKDEEITTDDDAMIIGSDNSEKQSASQKETTDSQKNSETLADNDESAFTSGEQNDDAYILDSSDTETADTDLNETNDDDSLLVPSGPTLCCPSCGFECPKSETPHYPGDSCPECKQAYLEKQ